jgi:hypothetical protein
MTNEQAVGVLKDALNILGQDGENWTKNFNYDEEEDEQGKRIHHCLFGAILEADGRLGGEGYDGSNIAPEDTIEIAEAYLSTTAQEAANAIADVYENETGGLADLLQVQNWQDNENTQWWQVKDIILKAIKKLKGGE